MKIMVYLREDGVSKVLLVPGKAAHLPPVLLEVGPGRKVRDAVLEALEAQEQAQGQSPPA